MKPGPVSLNVNVGHDCSDRTLRSRQVEDIRPFVEHKQRRPKLVVL